MFVLVFAWLAQRHKRWVALATGTALAVAAVGVFLAGFTSHQPLTSRVGVLLAIAAIGYAAIAIRSRRSQLSADGKVPDDESPADEPA